MKKIAGRNHSHVFTNQNRLLFMFVLLLAISDNLHAQEVAKNPTTSLHAGFNVGVLDAGYGPSLSIHLNFRPEKVLQTEMAMSYDYQRGTTFSNGDNYKSSAFTIAAGIRVNFRPQKNWNPSIYILPGIMLDNFDSEDNSSYNQARDSSLGALIGISNTFNKKHVITVGFTGGDKFRGVSFKYGFVF